MSNVGDQDFKKKEQVILACFYYHFFMALAIYFKKNRFKVRVACNLWLVACSTSKVQARSSVVMLLYLALNTQIVPYSFFNVFLWDVFFYWRFNKSF